MKRFSFLILMFLILPRLSYATLTAGYVPVTKTGGSNPTTQNGSIVDTGTSSGPGNVGIGSPNPTQVLDVAGNIHAATGLFQALSLGTFDTNNSLNVAAGAAIGDSTYTGVTAPPQGLIIQGNVGIGTPTPGMVLDVNGYIRGKGFIGTQSGASFPAGNVGIGTTLSANALDVATGGVAIGATYAGYRIAPANGIAVQGNVGIGTWIAQAALDMGTSGGIRLGGVTNTSWPSGTAANPTGTIGLTAVNGSATTYLRSDGAPPLGVTISPTMTGNWIFAPSSGNTLFSAGNVGIGTATAGAPLVITGTGTVSLTTTGNVGIGTLAPIATLAVNGSIVLTGTATSGGASYVCVNSSGVVDVQSGAC